MEQAATPAPAEAHAVQDTEVKRIVADLEYIAASADFFAPFARVADKLRTLATAPDARHLRPSQKSALLASLRKAYFAAWGPLPDTEQGQRELTMAVNALGTLILIWAGDDPVWTLRNPAWQDAHDFAHAFALEMQQYAVLANMSKRRRALEENRQAMFADLLSPPAPGNGPAIDRPE